jgi:hypothetical protein
MFKAQRVFGTGGALALILSLTFCLGIPAASSGMQAEVVVPSNEVPIPNLPYKSWSLFVVCNPSWLLPQGAGQMQQLYDQFKAYGAAIGPAHAAVWFKSSDGHIDTERNSQFCSQLKLKPSGSPYLIFTTRYPGEALPKKYPVSFPASESELGNHSILSLNALSAVETTRLLSSLADQLVVNDLSKVQVDSKPYWNAWQHAYESTRDEVMGLFAGVTVSFDTGFAKVEIPLSREPAKPAS